MVLSLIHISVNVGYESYGIKVRTCRAQVYGECVDRCLGYRAWSGITVRDVGCLAVVDHSGISAREPCGRRCCGRSKVIGHRGAVRPRYLEAIHGSRLAGSPKVRTGGGKTGPGLKNRSLGPAPAGYGSGGYSAGGGSGAWRARPGSVGFAWTLSLIHI